MNKKFLKISAIIILYIVSIVPRTNAATITFNVGGKSVGAASPFSVDIGMNSTTSINAVTLVVSIPESVQFIGSSDANSAVNLWVERPKLDDRHRITFSGLIPGGYKGQGGKLVSLKLLSKSTGNITLSLAKDSVAYTNTASATPETLISKPLVVEIVSGKENVDPALDDKTPPELFVPAYVQLSDENGSSWTVGFFTQDKGSGIKEYYVAESKKKIDVENVEKLSTLAWVLVESPAKLLDQKGYSYIYVKAIDNNGNERVARLAPRVGWYRRPISYIITTVLLLGVLYAFYRRKKSSRNDIYP